MEGGIRTQSPKMVPLDEKHEQGIHLFMPVDESQEISRISLSEELEYGRGIISSSLVM
jgi:hypothetical protein